MHGPENRGNSVQDGNDRRLAGYILYDSKQLLVVTASLKDSVRIFVPTYLATFFLVRAARGTRGPKMKLDLRLHSDVRTVFNSPKE